jgi:DNA-binding CsgD family transcriptional regulator
VWTTADTSLPKRVTASELALAGAALAVGAIGLVGKATGGDFDALNITVDGAVGAVLAGCGLALRRLPGHARIGLLVYLSGLAWLAENLVTTDWQPAYTLGVMLSGASPPVLGHALLAYPSGRLPGPVTRAFVGVGYAVGFGLTTVIAMVAPYDREGCDCPPFWLRLDDDGLGVYQTLIDVNDVANAVLGAGLVALLLWRWRRARDGERLALGPLLPPALLYAGIEAVDGFVRVVTESGSLPLPRSLEVVARGAIGICALWGVHRAATANEPPPYNGHGPDPEALAALTKQERIVLGLMAEGWSNQAIAERLVVSQRTVETHVGRIFRKLDLPPSNDEHRRVRAVLAYLGRPPNGDGSGRSSGESAGAGVR